MSSLYTYPENDYRRYLRHSAKGTTWGNHKYISIVNGRYIYPEQKTNTRSSQSSSNSGWSKWRVNSSTTNKVNKLDPGLAQEKHAKVKEYERREREKKIGWAYGLAQDNKKRAERELEKVRSKKITYTANRIKSFAKYQGRKAKVKSKKVISALRRLI